MQEHVHTGFYSFVFAGLSAVVMFNLLRYLAIHLTDYKSTQGLAKVIGATINFSTTAP